MKVFVLGAGPLPSSGKIANAGGLRTAQFLEKIQHEKGVEVVEVWTIEESENVDIKTKNEYSTGVELRQFSIKKNDPRLFQKIRRAMRAFDPDVLFGVNVFPSFVATKCADDKTPFWADLNGWILAERQIQAVSSGSDAFLPDAKEKEESILIRADYVSVVSEAQKFTTIGEMAAFGLLGKDNVDLRVEVVENSCRPLGEGEKMNFSELQFRGKVFPNDALAFLWIGGMNAWADSETLFAGLEIAMQKNPQIHFVMTGGVLKGIDEKQFPWFQKKVQESLFRKRFHFLGYVDSEKMPALFRECDAGLNVDRLCAETLTGARNRLNEFLRFSLPSISTQGSEITAKIAEKEAGIIVESGNATQLAEAIERIAHGGDFLEKMRYNGGKLCEEDFSTEKTTFALASFLSHPERIRKTTLQRKTLFAGLLYLKNHGIRAFFQKCQQKVFEKIG